MVRYLGQVDDMSELIAEVDIVALPTYYPEGTPRILVEAAASGKAIVATNIAGCRGLVRDGINGYLIPVKDSKALAMAIEALGMDPQKRIDFGIAGRRIVLGQYDERIVIRKTLSVYSELLCADITVSMQKQT